MIFSWEDSVRVHTRFEKMRKETLLLLLILFFSIFFRIYNLPTTLLFHFDQGYHALATREIWQTKRLVLLGHKTDVEGIFHGSTFYYLALPAYLLSSWNPVGVSRIFSILNGLAVIFIFLSARKLFNVKVGLLGSLFYVVSYSLISYSRWLSNVTLIPFFSTSLFYFFLKSRDYLYFLLPSFFLLGLISQLNGAIGFFFLIPALVLVFSLRRKLLEEKKFFIFSVIFFLLPILPLIIFDLRHNFLVSSSIIRLFFKGNTGFSLQGIFSNFQLLKSETGNLLSYQFFGVFFLLVFLTFVATVEVFLKKGKETKNLKFLLLFIFLPFLGLCLYPGGIHGFFSVGILPFLTILFAWSLIFWMRKKIWRWPALLFVFLIVSLNLYHFHGFLKPGFNLIPIGTRNLITLQDRLEATDFIYKKAAGQSFRTSIYIIPYSQYQPWDYVFSWYGQKKYGYLPQEEGKKTFVIFEPDYDFPYRLDDWLGRIEKDHGKPISLFKSHDLNVWEMER